MTAKDFDVLTYRLTKRASTPVLAALSACVSTHVCTFAAASAACAVASPFTSGCTPRPRDPPSRPPIHDVDLPSPTLYFAMTDRFHNGDPTNDGSIDPSSDGAYHGGDYAGIRAKLDYLAALGVDWLWISPIVDNVDHAVTGAGFPDWGHHGYWARDFVTLEPRFGTLDDLRRLAEAARLAGIRLVLDVVVNHVGYGAPLEADPAWTRSPARRDCGDDPITQCLHGLPDLRTEDPAVADAVLDAHAHWRRTLDLGIARVDSVRHVDIDLWRRFDERTGFEITIGEAWGAWPGDGDPEGYLGAFTFLFDFSFADRALAFATGKEDAAVLAHYLESRGPDARRYVTYLDTHDTPGFLYRAGGDKTALLVGAALEMTVPGVPLVYYGDEVARAGGPWPANRSDMPWTSEAGADHDVLERYRRLICARADLRGPYRTLAAKGRLIAFDRQGDVVVINAGDAAADVRLAGARRDDVLHWGASSRAAEERGANAHWFAVVPARSAGIYPAPENMRRASRCRAAPATPRGSVEK